MVHGKVPNLVYGYDKIPGEFFNLHINEAESKTVKRIFERYVYEGDGCLAIAKDLNNEGFRTKEIYSNQRIKKDAEQWLITENKEQRIISDELF